MSNLQGTLNDTESSNQKLKASNTDLKIANQELKIAYQEAMKGDHDHDLLQSKSDAAAEKARRYQEDLVVMLQRNASLDDEVSSLQRAHHTDALLENGPISDELTTAKSNLEDALLENGTISDELTTAKSNLEDAYAGATELENDIIRLKLKEDCSRAQSKNERLQVAVGVQKSARIRDAKVFRCKMLKMSAPPEEEDENVPQDLDACIVCSERTSTTKSQEYSLSSLPLLF